MLARLTPVAALVLAALSLGTSWAHTLEALPRLRWWPPELWIEATVANGQYFLFGAVGGPIDVAAILAAAALAFLARGAPGFRLALAAAVLLAVGLGLWTALVAPANAVLANWSVGSVTTDFTAVRDRWEYGHIAVAAMKLAGFTALASAVAAGVRRRP